MSIALNARADAPDVAMLATIAHDLKNPLTVVRMSAQLMRRQARRAEAVPSPWLETGLAEIEEAGTRMAQLIDEIMDLARLQAGEPLPLRPQPTDLAELAARSAAAARASSGRSVWVALAALAVVGHWDGARLRRVLENLVGNALKYSPSDREVVVRVGREVAADREWALLQVRDHGQGIPAADQPHLFEPFRRGSNVGGVRGTGLSLASVKQIVEAHGGTIAIKSVEGEGTTVTVRLPLTWRILEGTSG